MNAITTGRRHRRRRARRNRNQGKRRYEWPSENRIERVRGRQEEGIEQRVRGRQEEESEQDIHLFEKRNIPSHTHTMMKIV